MSSFTDAPLAGRLTSGRVVLAGAAWNGFGRAIPLLIAVAATPRLIALLGIERWGVFTLALSLVGMFGIFDLGLGRALTRGVAERLGQGDAAGAAALGWTGLLLIAGLGTLGGGALAVSVGPLTEHLIVMPPALQPQVARALYLLCLAVPLAVVNAGLWGILAAGQQFRTANLLGVPVQAAYFVGPLLVLPIWDDLVAVIAVLLATRLAAMLIYLQLCLRSLPALRQQSFDRACVAPLLRLGGWITVSNLLQPLVLYLDRFAIAAMLSVTATAYYATPFDMITRAWIIPVAVMNAVFPALAAGFHTQPAKAASLYCRANLGIFVLLLPACLALVLGGELGLRVWLGPAFAQHAGPVLRWLGVGLLFNGVAFVPAGLLDSIGRPDVNALWTTIEAAIYLPILLLTIFLFGIEGAAIAWSLRVAIDCFVRLGLAARHYPPARATLRPLFGLLALAAISLLLLRLGMS